MSAWVGFGGRGDAAEPVRSARTATRGRSPVGARFLLERRIHRPAVAVSCVLGEKALGARRILPWRVDWAG